VTFPYVCTMYPRLVHPPHYSPSYPILLLKITSAGFSVPYSYMCRKYINNIHLLYFLHLPSLFHLCPPLSMTCFTSLSCSVKCLLFNGVLPWYFSYKYSVL
jgi:hypothetical protein